MNTSYNVAEIKTNKQTAEQFATEYYSIFGVVPCVSCTGELHAAINKLSLHYTSNINQMEKEKRKYKLNADRLLWSTVLHKHFTKDNMTDEAAVELIKEHPEYEKYFDTSDPIVEALEKFEAGESELKVDITKLKTLDKKQAKLKNK